MPRLSEVATSRPVQYLLALGLVALSLVVFVDRKHFDLLREFTWSAFAIAVGITLLVYFLSGVEYSYLLSRYASRHLSAIDLVALPITMNLWSFLIPFQGALIYSTLYLRYRYDARLSVGIATNLYSYMVSMALTGACGLLLSLGGELPALVTLVAAGLALSPLVLGAGAWLLRQQNFEGAGRIRRFLRSATEVSSSVASLLRDRRVVLTVLGINLLHTAASTVWHVWIARSFGFDVPWLTILVFTLFLRLSIILKITPGNVGLQELLSGGIFATFGFDPAQGVLITLMTRLTSFLLMLTIGTASTVANLNVLRPGPSGSTLDPS